MSVITQLFYTVHYKYMLCIVHLPLIATYTMLQENNVSVNGEHYFTICINIGDNDGKA